jgi:DNA-binding NarL/FixJ family response regulator
MHQLLALIVSPDRSFAQRLCWLLSESEIMAVRAESDSHGAQLGKELKLDVLLLDVDRPPRELVRFLTDLQRSSVSAPMIWLSEKWDDEHIAKARHAGALGLVDKGGDPETILRAVRTVLERVPFFPPEHTHPATPGAKSLLESERLIRVLRSLEAEELTSSS